MKTLNEIIEKQVEEIMVTPLGKLQGRIFQALRDIAKQAVEALKVGKKECGCANPVTWSDCSQGDACAEHCTNA
mgnify:CR=1 FL=1